MTETMIRMQLDAVIAAVGRGDDEAALKLGLSLGAQVLLDFNRIANALEKLAGSKPQ